MSGICNKCGGPAWCKADGARGPIVQAIVYSESLGGDRFTWKPAPEYCPECFIRQDHYPSRASTEPTKSTTKSDDEPTNDSKGPTASGDGSISRRLHTMLNLKPKQGKQ
jgi:hypothetical protein